jgi:hypothetical protein
LATAEQLKKIGARRGPFTDPREGRVLKQIHSAFIALDVEVLSTGVLVDWAYGPPPIRKIAGNPSWHRQHIKVAASKICTPIGRATGKGAGSGCPQMWKIDPERAKIRSRRGRWERKQQRLGYVIDNR